MKNLQNVIKTNTLISCTCYYIIAVKPIYIFITIIRYFKRIHSFYDTKRYTIRLYITSISTQLCTIFFRICWIIRVLSLYWPLSIFYKRDNMCLIGVRIILLRTTKSTWRISEVVTPNLHAKRIKISNTYDLIGFVIK